jgi:translocation and assembly module TamB
MRKALHALLAVVSVGIKLPAVLVAVWGGFYIANCVQALTAPGVPIEYSYKSELGDVTVFAEAYQFDLERMEGYAQRVRVVGPDGETVASADLVELLFDGDVAVIKLNDPVMRVTRLEDGKLDVLDMLPIREEEQLTEGAFRLVIDHAVVEYTDVNVQEPALLVALDGVGVDGARGTYMFKGDVTSGTIKGRVAGSYDDDGRMIAEARLNESDVALLLAYVRPFLSYDSLDEFAYTTADTLTVDGTLQMWSLPGEAINMVGDAHIVATGLNTPVNLRNADFSGTISSYGTGFVLRGSASQRGFQASYEGGMAFGEDVLMSGALTARADSDKTVPPILRQFVDPGVTFQDARFQGDMYVEGGEFLFDGDLTAARADYAGETTTGIVSHVRLRPDGLTARFDQGEWAGIAYSGAIAIDFETGGLSGGLRSERGRLEPLAAHFGTDRLKGIVSAEAVLTGTLEEPVAEIYVRGSGGVQIADGPLTSIGVYEARGRLNREGLFLDRLTSNSQNGVVAAQGHMRWEDGGISLVVSGGGLDLSSFSEDLKGLGFLKATVTGTREDPEASGRLEVYGFEALGRKVPQIVADWSSDNDQLTLERFAARAGTGRIDGTAVAKWDDRSLTGQFTGADIRLEEWLSTKTVGAVSLQNGRVSGTLDDPEFAALLTAGPVHAGGVEVQTVEAQVFGTMAGVRSPSFFAKMDGGELGGSANYDFGTGSGTLASQFAALPLARVPLSDYSLALDGTADGVLNLSFGESGLTEGLLTADVTGLAVNGTAVGQGRIDASLAGDLVTAEASVGSLERYILLSEGRYDIGTKQVGGDLLVYNVLLEDVIEGAGKAIAEWPEDLRDLMENTKGLLNAALIVGGELDDPTIDVESLVMTDLLVRGRDAGVLRAAGRREAGVWTVRPQQEGPMWVHGDTQFFMSGTVTEDGYMGLNGELSNFQAAWLHTLFPDVPLVSGEATKFSFQVDGPYDDPHGRASLETANLGYFEGDKAVNLPLELNLDSIELRDGVFDVNGKVKYQALEGLVEGTVPLSSLYEDPEGRDPMAVSVQFVETAFDQFAPYVSLLDAERSDGTVSGFARITGLWGALNTQAEIHASGSALAFKEHGTFFKNVRADVAWDNGTLTATSAFEGEEQGAGALDFRAVLPDVFAENVGLDEIRRQTTLDGNVTLSDYRLQFVLPNAESASGATITTNGLRLSGTIERPRLSGDLALDQVFVRLPDEFAGAEKPIVYQIDPAFEGLSLTVAPGARLVTDTARIEFFGSGRLDGSLQNPDVSLPLTVTGGRFDMPTARISLEEGGSIIVSYRSLLGTSPAARVDLNLEGTTTISARRASNEYETYDIQLLIRGNLLDEDGLNITASSDPPDLSSEQIMAVLGRKEQIENFARGGSDNYLRETLYSFGLPSATNVLTSGLAAQLGLDYIAVDYNPFDGTVFTVGKTLARGLMLRASRQLEANPGEPLKYEVELTYRLPMQDAFFSRVRLGFGFDELVPWRVRLNWSRRF